MKESSSNNVSKTENLEKKKVHSEKGSETVVTK